MRVATAGAVALLAACAARGPALVVRPPRVDTEHERLERARHYEHAMEAWRTYRARGDRVLAPILVESASLCEPSRPKDVERSADYLGCYLSARAGYDVAALPAFWRRWAALAPFGITHQQTTHPGTSERALLLEATVEEIERKRSAGLPLLPELAQ